VEARELRTILLAPSLRGTAAWRVAVTRSRSRRKPRMAD